LKIVAKSGGRDALEYIFSTQSKMSDEDVIKLVVEVYKHHERKKNS
jgi:hypothetical protein